MNTYTYLEWSGIDHKDAPKYCDAYIVRGKVNGRNMTEDELDALRASEQGDELLMRHLY